jgi:hypothetical protein
MGNFLLTRTHKFGVCYSVFKDWRVFRFRVTAAGGSGV